MPLPGSRALRFDRLRLRRLAGRGGRRRFRASAWSKRAGVFPTRAAGKRPPSRSSSTAKTRGSTSRGADVRSCGRCTACSQTHPELRPVTMREAAVAPQAHPERHLSRLVDRWQLLHLDRPRRRPARLAAAPGRAADVRPRLAVSQYGGPGAGLQGAARSPKAATGSGGMATTIRRITTSSSTSSSGAICGTSIRCLDSRYPRSSSPATSAPSHVPVSVAPAGRASSARCSMGGRPATSSGCRRASSRPMRHQAP